MSKVGDMIQKGREEKNLSMRELAEKAHVNHSDISRAESGEREVPSPKFLRKISRFIGVNYNDLMYASGMGAQVSPLNPYLINYYNGLTGKELKEAMDSIEGQIKNNSVIVESLKKNVESEKDEEKKNTILETIEDLDYQTETNKEIMKLLESKAIEEYRNGK